MINKFFFLIGRGFIGHLFLVLFAVLLATVLELIGIGLIPAFISFIINPERTRSGKGILLHLSLR